MSKVKIQINSANDHGESVQLSPSNLADIMNAARSELISIDKIWCNEPFILEFSVESADTVFMVSIDTIANK